MADTWSSTKNRGYTKPGLQAGRMEQAVLGEARPIMRKARPIVRKARRAASERTPPPL